MSLDSVNEKLSEYISKIVKREQLQLEAINNLELSSRKAIQGALQQSLIRDIDEVCRKALNLVKVRSLYGTVDEILLLTEIFNPATQLYEFNTIFSQNPSRKILADHRNQGFVTVKVEEFKKIIENLKASILEGKLDQHLHETENKLIYDKLYESTSCNEKVEEKPRSVKTIDGRKLISLGKLEKSE